MVERRERADLGEIAHTELRVVVCMGLTATTVVLKISSRLAGIVLRMDADMNNLLRPGHSFKVVTQSFDFLNKS